MAFSDIDVQQTFDDFVEEYGGIVLDPEKKTSPNADYVFPKAKVVAELKILKEDPFSNKYFRRGLAKTQNEWIQKGYLTRAELRAVRVFRDLPDKCRADARKMYSRPLKSHVEKANKQIRSTKQEMELNDYKGLLILVSDGNFLLEPKFIRFALWRLFAAGRYSGINTITYLTVNALTTRPSAPNPARLWINIFRDLDHMENEVLTSFLDDVHDKWADYFTKVTGITLNRISEVNEQGLSDEDYLADTKFLA